MDPAQLHRLHSAECFLGKASISNSALTNQTEIAFIACPSTVTAQSETLSAEHIGWRSV